MLLLRLPISLNSKHCDPHLTSWKTRVSQPGWLSFTSALKHIRLVLCPVQPVSLLFVSILLHCHDLSLCPHDLLHIVKASQWITLGL